MNEKLLQYLWNFKIFTGFDFRDTEGNEIEILDFGKWNFDSGPDFLFSKIRLNGLLLAGNVELHVKSSDWIFHRHTGNPEFENIILHVVFLHDVEIEALNAKNIPTLELRNYIDEKLLWKYESMVKGNSFIPCETIFEPEKVPFHFSEESLLKKLEIKSGEIGENLHRFKNNYEAVLFHLLAYAFGLKVNAPIFKQMAESVDFSVVTKVRQNHLQLEALFFGLCGWLQVPEDLEMTIWKREFDFLKTKFQLPDLVFTPKFSKLRPPNFPTIRLSQLAYLYHTTPNLFSKVIAAKKTEDLLDIFRPVKASEYWNCRFSFGKVSSVENEKFLTDEFIFSLIINAILPVKYTYGKNTDEEINDRILDFYRTLPPEKNSITSGWKNLNVPVENSLDSQAYLFHHKNFCTVKNCLNCSIGLQLLKK